MSKPERFSFFSKNRWLFYSPDKWEGEPHFDGGMALIDSEKFPTKEEAIQEYKRKFGSDPQGKIDEPWHEPEKYPMIGECVSIAIAHWKEQMRKIREDPNTVYAPIGCEYRKQMFQIYQENIDQAIKESNEIYEIKR